MAAALVHEGNALQSVAVALGEEPPLQQRPAPAARGLAPLPPLAGVLGRPGYCSVVSGDEYGSSSLSLTPRGPVSVTAAALTIYIMSLP